MRLGQLAREYNVSVQEILSYLKKMEPDLAVLSPNSKVDERIQALVTERFESSVTLRAEQPEEPETGISETLNPESAVSEVADTMEVDDAENNELDASSPEVEQEDRPPTEDETIETDKLLELLESEEETVDLSKIRLIKAPKKELDGLKVVGKIELPEPRSKTENSKQEEKVTKPDESESSERRRINEEEREKRRLRAKRKKEEYEARQEARRKEKEKQQIKSRREAHYQQKVQRAKTLPSAATQDELAWQDTVPEVAEPAPAPPKARTLFGKFWRWLNP